MLEIDSEMLYLENAGFQHMFSAILPKQALSGLASWNSLKTGVLSSVSNLVVFF